MVTLHSEITNVGIRLVSVSYGLPLAKYKISWLCSRLIYIALGLVRAY